MLNNDFYLLRDEPGYRGGEPTDEDPNMPHCWDCCEDLTDGEGTVLGGHVFCATCASEIRAERGSDCGGGR